MRQKACRRERIAHRDLVLQLAQLRILDERFREQNGAEMPQRPGALQMLQQRLGRGLPHRSPGEPDRLEADALDLLLRLFLPAFLAMPEQRGKFHLAHLAGEAEEVVFWHNVAPTRQLRSYS